MSTESLDLSSSSGRSSEVASQFAEKSPSWTDLSSKDVEQSADGFASRDEAELASRGRTQVFDRRFGMSAILGMVCTMMITWEGLLVVLSTGLVNGGPQGLFCQYLFVWLGAITQISVMAELGSMIPIAGGQYNWVAILAPKRYARFMSYMTGWITLIAWQALIASGVYMVGSIITGMVSLNNMSWQPARWQLTLIFYAVITVSLTANTVFARWLPKLEASALPLHICGFVAILIVLASMGKKLDAKEVFQTFWEYGGWPTRGLTFFVGMNGPMLSFIGADGAAHMAEETRGAARVIPRAMMFSVVVNGLTGLGMLIVVLFCLQDPYTALFKDPTGYPFMWVFMEATGSAGAATGMTVVVTLILFTATIGVLAAGSRMMWAFSREGGTPLAKWISKVPKGLNLPVYAIAATAVINILLALINIGSTAAFNAFIGVCVAAFYTAYIISASCLLWRKLRGDPLKYGPFKLGILEVPVIVYSLCYSVIGTFFSFWPAGPNPTLQDMNWAVVVLGGAIVLILLYWVFRARHNYVGPSVEDALNAAKEDGET